MKAMFNWAINNEIIVNVPNLKAVKKITKLKTEKLTFSIAYINRLLNMTALKMLKKIIEDSR